MTETPFDNVLRIVGNWNYDLRNVMIAWKDVHKETMEGNAFDFVPHLDQNQKPVVMFIREGDKVLCGKLDNSCYIDENSHPLLLISKMKKRYDVRENRTRLTFLLVKNDAGEVVGFINHNDFNKPPLALLLWEVTYFFEGILSTYLSEVVKETEIAEKLSRDRKNSYKRDRRRNSDLHPIYYMDLKKKLELYKDIPKEESEKLAFPPLLPDLIKRFRNSVAHPGEKPKIIRKKEDLSCLHQMFSELNGWLDKHK